MTMDAPNRELNSTRFQGFPPYKYMLVHTVDESAVEIRDRRKNPV
jgi:hypothetical protein